MNIFRIAHIFRDGWNGMVIIFMKIKGTSPKYVSDKIHQYKYSVGQK